MKTSVLFAVLVSLSAGGPTHGPHDSAARVPVLLELFTSEGCSSCPPADKLLQTFDQQQPIDGADLIVLSEHVDYWDRLGWRDPFSSAQYTARQQDYTNKFNLDGVYTPQLVVDGRFGLVGSNARAANVAIQTAIREPKTAIEISNVARNGNQVSAHIGLPAMPESSKAKKAVLFVAIADNRAESQVARGENAGRALAHVGVVRVLKQVGEIDLNNMSSKDVTLPVAAGAGASGLRLVAFLQDPRSGHVLGVAAQKI
jgi:hypothetical protein